MISGADSSLRGVANLGLGIPIFVIMVLAMIILPLPSLLLDLFFTFNIILALMVLLAGTYAARPLDFSIFPTILLVSTLLRLALNIASTRVVLMRGHTGTDAVGQVIESFGQVVIGGSYAVGIVVFLILVIINFVVVTKGAGRISEVSARFTLDSMPGKQMAIDADLNAGIITQEEAKTRREEISQEADFYGSMDGASKFVRGDAVAGILILFINLFGGIIIGMAQHGLGLADAMHVYALLTIGDGLVAQIPSLLLSTAAAIMVTRVSSHHDVSEQVKSQVLYQYKPLGISSGVLCILGLIPGMPHMVFLSIGSLLGFAAYYLYQQVQEGIDTPNAPKGAKGAAPGTVEDGAAVDGEAGDSEQTESEVSWDDVASIDEIALEVGYKLIPFVDTKGKPGELMNRIKGTRKKLSQELGFLVPSVHIRDDLNLPPTSYRISVMGVVLGEDEVKIDKDLAIHSGQVFGEVEGIKCKDPAFGLDAVWIARNNKEQAQSLGYTVVDPSTVIATHMSQIIQDNSSQLFGHDQAQKLLDILSKSSPKLVDDLIPEKLSLSAVVKVLQNCLDEHVPIRDIRTIIETLSEHCQHSQDPALLTEFVRASLARLIMQNINGPSKELSAATLDAQLEQVLSQGIQGAGADMQFNVDPAIIQGLQQKLIEFTQNQEALGMPAILLVPMNMRRVLAKLYRGSVQQLNILAYNEVPDDKDVNIVATLTA